MLPYTSEACTAVLGLVLVRTYTTAHSNAISKALSMGHPLRANRYEQTWSSHNILARSELARLDATSRVIMHYKRRQLVV
jgi:hypothetical protein